MLLTGQGPDANDVKAPSAQKNSLSGGMAEWFKAAVLKTVDRKVRGFESLSLRSGKRTGEMAE